MKRQFLCRFGFSFIKNNKKFFPFKIRPFLRKRRCSEPNFVCKLIGRPLTEPGLRSQKEVPWKPERAHPRLTANGTGLSLST